MTVDRKVAKSAIIFFLLCVLPRPWLPLRQLEASSFTILVSLTFYFNWFRKKKKFLLTGENSCIVFIPSEIAERAFTAEEKENKISFAQLFSSVKEENLDCFHTHTHRFGKSPGDDLCLPHGTPRRHLPAPGVLLHLVGLHVRHLHRPADGEIDRQAIPWVSSGDDFSHQLTQGGPVLWLLLDADVLPGEQHLVGRRVRPVLPLLVLPRRDRGRLQQEEEQQQPQQPPRHDAVVVVVVVDVVVPGPLTNSSWNESSSVSLDSTPAHTQFGPSQFKTLASFCQSDSPSSSSFPFFVCSCCFFPSPFPLLLLLLFLPNPPPSLALLGALSFPPPPPPPQPHPPTPHATHTHTQRERRRRRRRRWPVAEWGGIRQIALWKRPRGGGGGTTHYACWWMMLAGYWHTFDAGCWWSSTKADPDHTRIKFEIFSSSSLVSVQFCF